MYRVSMAALVARTRLLIADTAGPSQTFDDNMICDSLDDTRDDVRYELLTPAPTIINSAGTGGNPQIIWADYYSAFHWWETDAILEGNNVGSAQSWVVLTPAASDFLVGHWQFELNQFTSATPPSQYPPVYATGKVYDLYATAANLLEIKAAQLMGAYNFASDGQSFNRSQMFQQTLTQANEYRRRARVRTVAAIRDDFPRPTDAKATPVLGDLNGDWWRQ